MTMNTTSPEENPVVLVTGSSGFVGQRLVPYLESKGYVVRGLSRNPDSGGVFWWDPAAHSMDSKALEGVQGVIHLAGEGIAAGRWTEGRKKRILDSRVDTTRTLVQHMRRMTSLPRVLVSSSGVNYYESGPGLRDEQSPSGDSFLAEVCRQWEGEARKAREFGVRTVQLRTGVVLDPSGGALARMLPVFRMGTGGPIGTGRQGFPWIGMEDLIRIMEWALREEMVSGPVNAVHPDRVNQEAFSKALGKALNRPAVMPLPAFVVKATFGQMGRETLLADLNIIPQVLQSRGFAFRYKNLGETLDKILP